MRRDEEKTKERRTKVPKCNTKGKKREGNIQPHPKQRERELPFPDHLVLTMLLFVPFVLVQYIFSQSSFPLFPLSFLLS